MAWLSNIRKLITIFVVLITILFLTSASFAACEVNISNESLELRSTGNFLENISAENNDEIDIRIGFDIDYVGNDCPNNIDTKAKIYRTENGEERYYKTTTTKRQTLEEGRYLFIWSNDFRADDRYDEYRVEGIIKANEEEFVLEGYITIEDNSCNGINIITRDFVINEGREITKNFIIENNTTLNFNIENIDVYFSTPIVSKGNVDYDSYLRRYSNENVKVSLTGNYVSYDRTARGTISVSGYLGNNYCSSTTIGRETFSVTVKDTGAISSPSTTPSGQCNELSLITRKINVNENESTRTTFYLKNESTKRFEITHVDFIENEVELNSYYFEQYVFPNNLGSITVDTIAPNLTTNNVYNNTIRVKGRFSDGKTCQFNDIEKDFEVIVTEKKETLDCSKFSIHLPSKVDVKNTNKINYTIINNTIRSAIINVSGLVENQIINVPSNSSISNALEIQTNKNGEIVFNPYIAGCSYPIEKVNIINTSKGNLEGVNISTEMEPQNKLTVKFNNTTEKQFTGILKVNIDGYFEESKTLTLPQGESFTKINLKETGEAKTGQGTIIFNTGEEEIIKNISNDAFFAGLFIYGGTIATIAIILIIIVIAIVVVITMQPTREVEEWENTNKK